MRRSSVGATLLAVVCAQGANAADISAGKSAGGYSAYSPYVAHIEPVIVYDSEPGVIVRCYWCPPWRNRHYFPMTGKRPKVGRREILPKHRVSKPDEYFRYWWASSFGPESPSVGGKNAAPPDTDSDQR